MSEIQEAVSKYNIGLLHWIDFYQRLVQERTNHVDTSAWNTFLDDISFDRRKYSILMRAYNYLEIKFPDLLISKNFNGSIYAIAQLPKLVTHLENQKTPQTEIDETIQKVLRGDLGEHSIRKMVETETKSNEPLTYKEINQEQKDILKSFQKALESLEHLTDSTVSIVGLKKVRAETGNECRIVAKKLLSIFSETYNSEEVIINL